MHLILPQTCGIMYNSPGGLAFTCVLSAMLLSAFITSFCIEFIRKRSRRVEPHQSTNPQNTQDQYQLQRPRWMKPRRHRRLHLRQRPRSRPFAAPCHASQPIDIPRSPPDRQYFDLTSSMAEEFGFYKPRNIVYDSMAMARRPGTSHGPCNIFPSSDSNGSTVGESTDSAMFHISMSLQSSGEYDDTAIEDEEENDKGPLYENVFPENTAYENV